MKRKHTDHIYKTQKDGHIRELAKHYVKVSHIEQRLDKLKISPKAKQIE